MSTSHRYSCRHFVSTLVQTRRQVLTSCLLLVAFLVSSCCSFFVSSFCELIVASCVAFCCHFVSTFVSPFRVVFVLTLLLPLTVTFLSSFCVVFLFAYSSFVTRGRRRLRRLCPTPCVASPMHSSLLSPVEGVTPFVTSLSSVNNIAVRFACALLLVASPTPIAVSIACTRRRQSTLLCGFSVNNLCVVVPYTFSCTFCGDN